MGCGGGVGSIPGGVVEVGSSLVPLDLGVYIYTWGRRGGRFLSSSSRSRSIHLYLGE